ncbi:unnamed protein product [Polarella glacialis]|uniref:peptidylprolyl isomerase n=1 Tax=Polarella glacialis TaxID=89957 RepID=A0A813GCA5_POLGL|nr:unnamed protein product [Polarella glacialis]
MASWSFPRELGCKDTGLHEIPVEEELEPGLEGYSDSGSEFHDLPAPELPPGVSKAIVAPAPAGSILKRPEEGDEVVVRCSGTWLDRASPFLPRPLLEDEGGLTRFTVGQGQVIRGLEVGILTMRLGETAKFRLSAEFSADPSSLPGSADLAGSRSFPEAGSTSRGQVLDLPGFRLAAAARLPGKAIVLVLEVSFVDWISRCDLFEDGSAIKSLLRRGDDKRKPVLGQVCLVSASLRLLAADDNHNSNSNNSNSNSNNSHNSNNNDNNSSNNNSNNNNTTNSADSGAAGSCWEVEALEHGIASSTLLGPAPVFAPGGERGPGQGLSWRLLDKVLLSMRRGEKAAVDCTEEVLLDGAPANLLSTDPFLSEKGSQHSSSRWLLELELQEFLETSDISFERDASVTMRSLRCRDSWPKCQDAGRCSLNAKSVTDSDGNVHVEDATLHFVLGSGEVCDELEAVAAAMQIGERAEVFCRHSVCEPKLGLEGKGLKFRFQVLGYEPGPWEQAKGDEAKLQALLARKEKGIEVLRAGRHRLAAYHFNRTHELLGYVDDFHGVQGGEDRKAKVAELKKACLLNRALCLLKDDRFKAVLKACDLVLDEEPRNMKALFRRAQAHLGLEDCFNALRDTRAVLQLEPGSSDARRLLAEVTSRQRALDISSKDLFVKMCDGLGKLPHPLDVD